MKKTIIIALLSMYLMSTTELYQLLKLPILISHFEEHKSQNNTITFFEFLYMHYSQADDHDGDKEKDMKLPFKSHSICYCSNFVVLSNQELHVFKSNLFFRASKKSNNHYTFLVSSSHLKAIWQPPQIC